MINSLQQAAQRVLLGAREPVFPGAGPVPEIFPRGEYPEGA
ncbi:hypothetical protein [Mycetocola spongiae]|nr:hypothetical protein [Mycetocola spongiae]